MEKNPDHLGGVVKAAKQWQKDQQNTLKNYAELAKKGKAYFVRYEDLISDSDRYTAEIVQFFGLPYDSEIENFHKDELTQKNASMQKAWNNLSQGVIKDNKKKYLKELTEQEIKVIEKICYVEMQYLGYECEFSKDELDMVTVNMIEDLNQKEFETIPYERSKGVKLNMEAKKVFYQKVMFND